MIDREKYASIIRAHADEPLSWGRSDCFTLMSGALEARGAANPFSRFLGAYRTFEEARAIMAGLGFSTLRDALLSAFPECPPGLAQRGDLCLMPHDEELAGGVVDGATIIGKSKTSIVIMPIERARLIVAVGALPNG